MRELLDTETTTPFQYLLVWFGLIGAGVGLHLPSKLVLEI